MADTNKMIIMIMLFIVWAMSFLWLVNLPDWIVGTSYETLVYVVWFAIFAIAWALMLIKR